MSKYGVFSGPNFPVFSPNTGKYGAEKARYLSTFHAVWTTCCRQQRTLIGKKKKKKIHDSHLKSKVANKCLNVPERVEVLEWNKRWSPAFPCCSVNRQCL